MAVMRADRLLRHLATELDAEGLRYASAPERMTGGYDTSVFSFRLDGAPPGMNGPLVLRLYPASQGDDKARFEGAAQNTLVGAGVPAAPVHLVCTDPEVLGGTFIVMDRLPGRPLLEQPDDRSSAMLGRANAELHDLPAEPVVSALERAGFQPRGVPRLLHWLDEHAAAHPSIGPSVDWLTANRPPEPATPSICHGDFHKLNVLVDGEGTVTGIVDWSALSIADPVLDVATTVMLFTIPARHLTAAGEFEPTDLDRVVADYLEAYQAHRVLDREHFDYHLALRCLRALTLGLDGQKVWRHDAIADDLARVVERVTGHRPLPR